MRAKDRRLGLTVGELASLDFWFSLYFFPPEIGESITRGRALYRYCK